MNIYICIYIWNKFNKLFGNLTYRILNIFLKTVHQMTRIVKLRWLIKILLIEKKRPCVSVMSYENSIVLCLKTFKKHDSLRNRYSVLLMNRWIFSVWLCFPSQEEWETASLSPSLPDDTAAGGGGAAAAGDNDKQLPQPFMGF